MFFVSSWLNPTVKLCAAQEKSRTSHSTCPARTIGPVFRNKNLGRDIQVRDRRSPTVGPSVAPPKIIAEIHGPILNVSNYPRNSAASASVDRLSGRMASQLFDELAPHRRAPRGSSSNRSLSALPLLTSELRTQLRMRPFRHDDGSSPTDMQTLTQICINCTSLSADNARCQAHFFFTTFCIADTLAQIDAHCSARRLRCYFTQSFARKIGNFGYYLARLVERSMKLVKYFEEH